MGVFVSFRRVELYCINIHPEAMIQGLTEYIWTTRILFLIIEIDLRVLRE